MNEKIKRIKKVAKKVNDLSDIEWDKYGLSELADEMGKLLIMIDGL